MIFFNALVFSLPEVLSTLIKGMYVLVFFDSITLHMLGISGISKALDASVTFGTSATNNRNKYLFRKNKHRTIWL